MCVCINIYIYLFIYILYIYICTYIFYITLSTCQKSLLVSSQFIPEENLSQSIVFSILINGISCNICLMGFGEINFQVGPRNFSAQSRLDFKRLISQRSEEQDFKLQDFLPVMFLSSLRSHKAENLCPSKLCCCGSDGMTEFGKQFLIRELPTGVGISCGKDDVSL